MDASCNTAQDSEAYMLAALFANVERVDDSGEANTLSLAEIQSFGSRLLDLFDGDLERMAEAA